MTANTTTVTELREELHRDLRLLSDGEGRVVDVDKACEAYAADPTRFAQVTQDNPDGDPVTGILLTDGPWWVAEDVTEAEQEPSSIAWFEPADPSAGSDPGWVVRETDIYGMVEDTFVPFATEADIRRDYPGAEIVDR